VIGFDTLFGFWVWYADGWNAILHWNSIRPRIGTEIRIERAILLHNDNDVLDFVNTLETIGTIAGLRI